MVEQKFYYYRQQLYVMENGPAVMIGKNEEISDNIKKEILGVF